MKNILVCDLMTRNPLTVGPETNLLDCAKKMLKNKVGALLIVNKNKKLLGYIAQKEILWTIVKKSKNLSGIKAIDISARKLTTIPPKLTIKEAMKRMKKFKRLKKIGYKTSQGYCEECGNYGVIYSSEGKSICGECRTE